MKPEKLTKVVSKVNHRLWDLIFFRQVGATIVLLLAAVCFGLVPLFARSFQEAGTSSASIALYRYGFTALLMLPFLPFTREKRCEALMLTSTGLFMGVSWIGYLEAIKVTSIAVAGIIYMSYPVFTMLFSWPINRQRPTLRGLLSTILVLISVYLAFSPQNLLGLSLKTLFWLLPAPISFGLIVVVISSCLHRLTTYERMACISLGATIGLTPLALKSTGAGFIHNIPEHWLLIFGITLFTALIPQLLYIWASPSVGPNRSAATGAFELPTMFITGWFFFGETIGGRELFSAILIITAIILAPVVQARLQS